MTLVELQWLIGDQSHSCVKGKAGRDVEVVVNLCEHLEYALRAGYGDLEHLLVNMLSHPCTRMGR